MARSKVIGRNDILYLAYAPPITKSSFQIDLISTHFGRFDEEESIDHQSLYAMGLDPSKDS